MKDGGSLFNFVFLVVLVVALALLIYGLFRVGHRISTEWMGTVAATFAAVATKK